MDKITSSVSILELVHEDLVIATQLEPSTYSITIKIYEREHFYGNPNLSVNQAQIDQYSIYPGSLMQTIAEIRAMYEGWSRITTIDPLELIGIHNQNPQILYVQFLLDQRYFIYKRCLATKSEMVNEELFGRKDQFRLRGLNHEDELYLISKLRFMPKTKKAISFYPMKTTYSCIKTKRHLY